MVTGSVRAHARYATLVFGDLTYLCQLYRLATVAPADYWTPTFTYTHTPYSVAYTFQQFSWGGP